MVERRCGRAPGGSWGVPRPSVAPYVTGIRAQLVADRQLIIPTRRLVANGLEAWDEVLGCNYEGMVAKDPGSSYTPGRTALVAQGQAVRLSSRGSRVRPEVTPPVWLDGRQRSPNAPMPDCTREWPVRRYRFEHFHGPDGRRSRWLCRS